MPTDLRTHAIVLRRTNYGEADRILNFLTPTGKVSALARGVRKEKSRLAGSIELFSVADIVVHQGHSELGTLTSAKMVRFYGGLLSDVEKLELASSFLKKLSRASEQFSSPEHFSLLDQALSGLNQSFSTDLVEAWFLLNLARIGGEELNLLRDVHGDELDAELQYSWDADENALAPDLHGNLGANEIKFVRFLLANPLAWATKVSGFEQFLPPIKPLALQFCSN